MDGRYLCTCTLCGPGGVSQSRSTAQRHRFDDKLRPRRPGLPPMHAPSSPQSPPSVPPVYAPPSPPPPPPPPQRRTVLVPAEVDNPHGPDVPESHLSSTSTSIERVVHYLHVRNAGWRFPASLVFATPPTEDSPDFTLRSLTELRYPNSTFRLSLRDEESAQVIGYECFLNETLQVLESYAPPEGDPLAARVTESINTTLDILVALEKHKGAEWDRQLRAQRSPDTFLLTGAYIPSLP